MNKSQNEHVLTIGNFDGMHRGHQQLVEKVVKQAKSMNLNSCLLTFDPHPMKILAPERGLKDLFPLQDRVDQAKALGIDEVSVLPFSRDLSELEPEEFFLKVVLESIHTKFLVVGHDFSFGKNRKGTHEVLKELCKKYQVALHIEPAFKIDDITVSSTKIREFVNLGDMKNAARFLGREFYLSGIIERGDGRGKKIGFPTANLFTRAECFPKKGVYVTWIDLLGEKLKSVTNVGENPTFIHENNAILKVETHILDFDKDIYGQKMKVHFLSRLRDEKKFSGIKELVKQIKIDVEKTKEYPWTAK